MDLYPTREQILNVKKEGYICELIRLRSLKKLQLTILSQINFSELINPVRNTQCKSESCVYELDELIDFFKMLETNEQQKNSYLKCPNCDKQLALSGFFIDFELQKVLQKIKTEYFDEYDIYCLQINVNSKNQWTFLTKNDENIMIKSEDYFLKDLPIFQSFQNSPAFYENGWIFMHSNIDALNNNKLQSVLYTYFPSLNKWKYTIIFENMATRKQSYFQPEMTVSRLFYNNKHSILATGGQGYPNLSDYADRVFQVDLFTQDPLNQIPSETNLIQRQGMIYNRAFHRSVYFNQRVYVFGGLHMNNETKKESVLKACEYFDPVNNQWREIQPLKFERQQFSVCVYNEKFYVIGGKAFKENKIQYEVQYIEIYDPHADNWGYFQIFNQILDNCYYFTEYSFSFVQNNQKLVVFGGKKSAGNQLCQLDYENHQDKHITEADLNYGGCAIKNNTVPVHLKIKQNGGTNFQAVHYANRVYFGLNFFGRSGSNSLLIPNVVIYDEFNDMQNVFTIQLEKKLY